MNTVVAVAVVLLLTGCSARQGYATLQTTGRAHAACEAMRNAEQAARCEADFRKPFDEYQRERREVLHGAEADGSTAERDQPTHLRPRGRA